MKFKINKQTLANSLRKVSHVVNAKSPILALNGIFFDVNEKGLTLVGSDTEITIKTNITENISIKKTGKLILPKFVEEIIRKMDDENIEIELISNDLVLFKSNKSEFKINGIDASQFPNIDYSLTGDLIKLNNSDMIDIINETSFAVSTEVLRPQLTGVNFVCENNVITCVATDSFRLARKNIQVNDTKDFNIIIPGKCLSEVNKLLTNNKDNIDIYLDNQKILFNFDDTIIISRLIKGSYPPTANLIPTNFECTLVINKKVIKDALDRANILSINTQNFTVNLEKNVDILSISSNNKEVGSINENLDYINYIGNEIKVSFNSKYVIEALNTFKEDNIKFQFNGKMNPIILEQENNNNLIQLILPVKNPF
ncbi:MAG: DNA polymerase III subunit beta [Bacilli bacterium]|nr:DNA polymerase III subunit beta [Bacilli bacterium]